jgi:hypothetical protein
MNFSARTTGVLAVAATVRSPPAVEAATTILDVHSLRRRLSVSGGRRQKRTVSLQRLVGLLSPVT